MASGDKIKCFLIEPTDQVTVSAWRDSYEKPCTVAPEGYHCAEVRTRVQAPEDPDVSAVKWDGAVWPTHCPCGYEFTDDDPKGLTHRSVYRNPETGEEYDGPYQAPVGAIWWAKWGPLGIPGSVYCQRRNDGRHLMCRTPGGTWDVDSVASNGPGWQWYGAPPEVTAMPSILQNSYHGWLRDGYLVEV